MMSQNLTAILHLSNNRRRVCLKRNQLEAQTVRTILQLINYACMADEDV